MLIQNFLNNNSQLITINIFTGVIAMYMNKTTLTIFDKLKIINYRVIDILGTDLKTHKIITYIMSNGKNLYLFSSLKTHINSISSLFTAAEISERETAEMIDIIFLNIKDGRKLLLDYGVNFHPLLKNSPLTGYIDVKYNSKKEIQYIPIKFSQTYRLFR